MRESFKIYDIVRIDHFRGFESYWEIPAGSDTAAPGEWVKGPGYKLFAAVKEELGELNIIAEDLGFMTDEVIELRERTGFPGMKEHTITIRFLVGTVMRLMMRLVSTWLVTRTVKNTKQWYTLCFVQYFHQLALWQLQLCKIY
ncbi:4-alpha-glucanotransferase (amylomaltase) [Streptococcus pneumoniae]|nr:4-alpha-glucanotransferase (amylomaltase) [Streptococcus pneumoniae]